MKIIQYITILVLIPVLLGCNQQPNTDEVLIKNQVDKTVKTDSTFESQRTENSKYYIKTDTLEISTETLGTIKISKNEFNQIVDNHPELYNDHWESPDNKYYCYGDNSEFGSEAGKDYYYILYAYFLKQKNGVEKYDKPRKKLVDIYRNINSLFQRFQHGGTYFGHQYQRILGYAEYSVLMFSKQNDNFEKTYDISKQKELYIKSLRQLIEDEIKIDNRFLDEEKREQKRELNKTVDVLNELITDVFYLRRTQEFHYEHYEYH